MVPCSWVGVHIDRNESAQTFADVLWFGLTNTSELKSWLGTIKGLRNSQEVFDFGNTHFVRMPPMSFAVFVKPQQVDKPIDKRCLCPQRIMSQAKLVPNDIQQSRLHSCAIRCSFRPYVRQYMSCVSPVVFVSCCRT